MEELPTNDQKWLSYRLFKQVLNEDWGNGCRELQLASIPYHVAKSLRNKTTSAVMAFSKDSPFSAVAC